MQLLYSEIKYVLCVSILCRLLYLGVKISFNFRLYVYRSADGGNYDWSFYF